MSALPAVDRAAPAAPPAPAAPWYAPVRSTLIFLAVPAAILAPAVIFGFEMPRFLLYFVAACTGLVLLWRCVTDPEWLLAVVVLYIPFKAIFVVPIAPGINGTNALLLMMLFAWVAQRARGAGPRSRGPLPATLLVAAYAFWSGLSMFTAAYGLGMTEFFGRYAVDIKGWIDQFVIFYLFLALLRDGAMARRVVLYMMLATLIVLAVGGVEWMDKRNAASIESARVLGPQLQPNDYGAFLVYGATFFVATLLRNLRQPVAWATITPVLLLTARVLLATFSRGAYLAMGACGVVAAWLRGRSLTLLGAGLAAVALALVPELMPQSLQERMSQTGEDEHEDGLDSSSRTRLILWRAAIEMTAENPLLGMGFKMFPVYKGRYTEVDVLESDNHNMFLYLCSQMGIPALLLFLLILWRMFRVGQAVLKRATEPFAGTVGLATAAMVPAVLVVNMFGSRMVDIGVSVYVWITLAVALRLYAELPPPRPARAPSPFVNGAPR